MCPKCSWDGACLSVVLSFGPVLSESEAASWPTMTLFDLGARVVLSLPPDAAPLDVDAFSQ